MLSNCLLASLQSPNGFRFGSSYRILEPRLPCGSLCCNRHLGRTFVSPLRLIHYGPFGRRVWRHRSGEWA
ncbi:hypothetical protein G4B88_021546 [Cannabis sativa]|uniref:Uncharacterized protein n=1 Tax=Cannabis sativa TaxID=3483 RepID=A0A7J6GIT3_CANSA|nr:hypothetical protein G4B88_008573 [Cannabis sativa]KAF4382763.1 hypothetical protein G4B88_021546 [Cannabis sativa]